jgi:hypothetical protein
MNVKNEYIKNIQTLSYNFAKYHYDKYVNERGVTKIDVKDIKTIVDSVYTTQLKNDLASFIRMNMKMLYKDGYNSFLTENIMNGIFEDDEYTRNRICVEIETFQSRVIN